MLYYDFDTLIMGRHSATLGEILEYAQAAESRLTITGHSGATLLSNGTVLSEGEALARMRAEEVGDLLRGTGLEAATIVIDRPGKPETPDGVDDWRSRKVGVRVDR